MIKLDGRSDQGNSETPDQMIVANAKNPAFMKKEKSEGMMPDFACEVHLLW